MQKKLFPELEGQENNIRVSLRSGLELSISKGYRPQAKLFRSGVLIKQVDLSDKVATRLFIVETVELGATKSRLAEALGISRQTIHNYEETVKYFGREGLINSYQPANSKNREKQRADNKKKIPRGNKARILEAKRKQEREEREESQQQLSLFSQADTNGIPAEDAPFAKEHDWQASRYAGVFMYLIYLVSEYRWFTLIANHFGGYYKIFQVFLLMVGRNIPSIEQLKNVHKGEAGLIVGLGRIPSKPKVFEWFYLACSRCRSPLLLKDFFRYQLRMGLVGAWFWFVDGHLLPYTGKAKVHYAYNTQRRLPVPGRTNLVTCDGAGRIVDFDIQEGKGDLRQHIIALHDKWKEEQSQPALFVFDREGYGADFFHQLVSRSIHFATWDKHVDTAKLAQLDDDCFVEELQVNGKQYGIFEGTKTFRVKDDDQEKDITLRRIYLWNKSCNRRTCGLAWTGDSDISLHDCARAVLNRWGASENTFKHLADRFPFHYHPGFRMKQSEKQEIANPEIKEKRFIIRGLKKKLTTLLKKFSKAKEVLNKDGSIRDNSSRERLRKQITQTEEEIQQMQQVVKELPDRIDVSNLQDYRSFKAIDNEGKNLFDFVTTAIWNSRKEMVEWLRTSFKQDNEVVDLFYAITNCHGWISNSRDMVRVRLEPLQQPKRRSAQEYLCRRLTYLGAKLPSGKRLVIEVGDSPMQKCPKKTA